MVHWQIQAQVDRSSPKPNRPISQPKTSFLTDAGRRLESKQHEVQKHSIPFPWMRPQSWQTYPQPSPIDRFGG